MPTIGALSVLAPMAPVEGGVEGEDPTVGGHHPVAMSVRGSADAQHRPVGAIGHNRRRQLALFDVPTSSCGSPGAPDQPHTLLLGSTGT
jgi:hypothetical protein